MLSHYGKDQRKHWGCCQQDDFLRLAAGEAGRSDNDSHSKAAKLTKSSVALLGGGRSKLRFLGQERDFGRLIHGIGFYQARSINGVACRSSGRQNQSNSGGHV